MKLIIAVPEEETVRELKFILEKKGHEIDAVCSNTNVLVDYVKILKTDLVIMDLELPGKFKTAEMTTYLNEEFDIPVVYLIKNSSNSSFKKAILTNPFGLITDPGDDRQVNFTLELAYNKFHACLYLL